MAVGARPELLVQPHIARVAAGRGGARKWHGDAIDLERLDPLDRAEAPDASEALVRIMHVVGGHTERFAIRSEEHTSELQSLMRISYAVFCLKKKTSIKNTQQTHD